MLEFETKVVDRITGFTGKVVGRVEYLNGCVQYLVKPQMKKGAGKQPEGEWIDEQYLTVKGKQVKGTATAGGDASAPTSFNP